MKAITYNTPRIQRSDRMLEDGVWAVYNKGQLKAYNGHALYHYFNPQRYQTWSDYVIVHSAISACGSYTFFQARGYNYGHVSLVLVPYNVAWYMTTMGAPAPITYFDARQTPVEFYEDIENAVRYMQFPDGQQMLIDMLLDAESLRMWRYERFLDEIDNISIPEFDEFDGPPDIDIMEDYIEYEEEWIEPPQVKQNKGKSKRIKRGRETYSFNDFVHSSNVFVQKQVKEKTIQEKHDEIIKYITSYNKRPAS